MQYHAGEIGHRGGRAQARVFQLVCEPPQALALEVEVVQRQRQRQEQSLVAVPRPGALAVLLVQGKERAQVAVVVDAHHVGRGVMDMDVAMAPIARREHAEQGIGGIEEDLVAGRAAREAAVRGGVADGAEHHEAQGRDEERCGPHQERQRAVV